MELYVIKSMYSKMPLAEIRTDGKNIDWIMDNTNGKLAATAKGDFVRLKNAVDKSHHLEMTAPDKNTLGILRYSLENGDIVEMTTDGKTALLNGKLMSEAEKAGLMSAIASGKVKVKNKADIGSPLPIAPKIIPENEKPSEKMDDGIHKAIKKMHKKREAVNYGDSRYRDQRIDSMDFSETECPEMGRQLLYLLKYGEDDA